MKKAEWEEKYGYTNKHTCVHCKHCKEANNYLFSLEIQLVCLKRIEAGAGKITKPTFTCILWEQG
jgi:glutaredoxin